MSQLMKKRFPSITSIDVGTDGNTSFLRAARNGQLEKVLEHLESNIDINTSNANGLNALHLASKDGHVEIVAELLKRGAVIDAATKKGNTALHIASLAGQEEVVKLLVTHGASVNVQSQNGFTPLYMAAQENHDNVVRYLLSNGANQSLSTEDGFTPLAVAMQQGHDKVVTVLLENDTRGKVRLPALHIAAKKDDVKAAKLLLENEHNPDVTSKSGFTPLHIASHYGNQSIANLLVHKGADVNYSAKHNITPLHVAAKWGKVNMVTVLLEQGANIESKTRDGLTPLHCAARSGHEQVVDMLLEKGAPISSKTKNGLAPLHMSAQGDHVDAARILLYHRAPVDEVTVDYLTALHVAAHCGHVRVAKLLLDRQADANARALNGFTPLHIACKKNRIKVVELLLKHGASIGATTESGLTPLHVASFMGCMNIVIYLLQHDANPDVPTVRGETPLHLAARANQTDIIRILLRNGAQVDARAREQQTPLHIASRLGNVDIVMLLLQHGAKVDHATKDMYTALHIAAKEGQDEVATVLIDNGASLHATTKKGFTPLHLASKYGHLKVAKLLLQKEAPVDAQGKNGVTPLHVASHYDHQNVALLLLEKGASPYAIAKNGHTPLHIAAKKNQMDIANTLLEYGAKPNAESKAGFTPLHLSSQEGHCDMSDLLIEHEADTNHKAKNGLTPLHLCAQEDKVAVAEILVKNGGQVDAATKNGYTPLHIASHYGQINMVRFLLLHSANVKATTSLGYTPLHQAAQQGHTNIVNTLLEHSAQPNAITNNGQTPLHIAEKLGYITVIDTLKVVTESKSPTAPSADEKYRVVAPEAMHETFMSDSEEEGGEDTVLGDQTYRYLTADEMKSLGDDSLPIDVTRDERIDSNKMVGSAEIMTPPRHIEDNISPEHVQQNYVEYIKKYTPDNIDIDKHPINIGFLVSFLVDARGGAMRGCRHSGVRVIVPPRCAPSPTRITCRYVRPQRTPHPPPLMEGEALASRVLELGPVSAKFLGPVIIEVPHFAALRGNEREIVILRSDNGESWKEHTVEATEDILNEVLHDSFEAEDLNQLEDISSGRITRIVTQDFPQYFAVVSRVKQEVHAIGPEGGMVSSTVVPQVQAVFPQGALTKKIKVGLQAQPIDAALTAKLLGHGVAVSPVVTVEPRRRKFHKAITLSMPAPRAHSQGMINQYSGSAPTLRLLCSITGGTTRAQWEDVTGSTPLNFVNDCVSFTTTVSARFWLMDCRNVGDATKMATELYREAIHVPFMAKFVVFAKRVDPLEARLRVFCMTDDKEDKTLEHQEHFTEVAKSRDVEVLEGKPQYIEFAGNLVPITKSGEQLQFSFRAFRENRLPFSVRVKDQHAEAVSRCLFMREPKLPKGEPPQQPICILNIVLPDDIVADTISLTDSEPIKKQMFANENFDYYRPDPRLADMSNLLGDDWVPLAAQLGLSTSEINVIKSEYPESIAKQAQCMLRMWLSQASNKTQANILESALRRIGREDIIPQCLNADYSPGHTIKEIEKQRLITKVSIEPKKLKEDPSKTPEEPSLPTQQSIDKYSAEEKIVEETISEEEDFNKTVTERRHQIEERLSVDRTVPASSQRVEIVQEISSIKRQSLVENKIAEVEQKVYSVTPTETAEETKTTPPSLVIIQTTTVSDAVDEEKPLALADHVTQRFETTKGILTKVLSTDDPKSPKVSKTPPPSPADFIIKEETVTIQDWDIAKKPDDIPTQETIQQGFSSSNEEKILDKPLGQQLLGLSTIDDSVDTDLKTILDQTNAFIQFESQPEPHNPITEKYTNIEKPNAKKTTDHKNNTNEKKKAKKGFFGSIKTFVERSFESDSDSEKSPKKQKKQKKEKKHKEAIETAPSPICKPKLPTPPLAPSDIDSIPFADTPPTYKPPAVPPENRDKSPKKKIKSKTVHLEEVTKTIEPYVIEAEEFSIVVDPTKKESPKKSKETFTINIDESIDKIEKQILEKSPILTEEKIMKPTAALEKDSRRLTKPLDEINAPIDNINMSFNDVKSYTTDLIQNEINFNPWFYEYQATSIKKEESKIEDKQDKEVLKEPKKKKREEKSGFFGLFKKKEPKKDEDLLVSERITADFDEKQKKIDDCKGFLSTEVQHYEDAKPMHKLTDEQAIYQNGSTATEEAPPDKKIFSNILESTVEVQSKPVLQGILKKRDVDEDKQKYEKNLATTHEFLSSEVHNYEDGEVIRKETSSAKPSKRKEEIDCQQVPTTLEDLKEGSQKTVIESVPEVFDKNHAKNDTASVQEIKLPELKLHTDLKLETNMQTENVIKEVEASLKADSFKCKSNKEETFVSGAIDSKVLAQEFLSTEIIYYEDGKLLAKEELSNVVHVIDKTDNQNGEAPAESSRGGFLNIFKMTKKEEVIESDEQDKQNVPQFVSPKLLKETTAKSSEAKKEIVESVHESPKKKDVGIFKIFKAKTSEKEIKTDIENSNLIEKQKNDCHAFLSTELQLYEDGKLLTEDLPAKQIEPILLETSKKIMVDSKASPKPKHGGIFKILKKTKSEDKSLEEAEHKMIIPETNKFISTEQTYYEDNKVNQKEEIKTLSQVVHPQKIAETKLEKTRDAATEKSVDNLEASSKSKPGGIFKIFKKPKTEDEKLADTTKDNEQAQVVSHTFLSTEKHLYEDGIRSKPEEIPAPSIDTSEKVVPKTKSKEIKDDITKKIIDNIEASPKTKRGGIFKMFKKSKTGKEASEDDIKESDPTKHLTETDKFLSTEVELYEDGKLATAKDTTASINILEVTQQSEKDPKENVDVLKSKDIIIIKGSLEKTVEESPLQAHKLAADVFLSTEKELYEDGLLAQSEYERKSKHAQEEIAEILTQPIDASFKSKQDDTKISKKAEVEPHQTISGVKTFLSTEIKLYEDSKLTKDDQQSILITAEKPKTISEEITEKIVQNVEESPKSKRGGVFKIFKKSKTEEEVKDEQELQKHIDDSHKFLSTELELYEDGKFNQEKEKIASNQEVESKHIIIKEATSEEIVEKEVEKSLKKTESSSKPKQGGILKVFKKTKKDENVEKNVTDNEIEKIINASRGFISKELEFYEDARLQKETFVIPTKISKSQDLIEESKSKQIKEEIDKLNETLETSSKPEQSGMLKVFKKSKDQQNKKHSEHKECQKNIKLSGEFLSTELNLYDDGKTETKKNIVGGTKIKQVPEVLKKITDNLKSTDVVQIFKPQKDKYEETQNQESKEIKEENVEKTMQDVESSPKSNRGLFGIFKKPKKEENKNLLKQDSIDNKQSGPTNEKQKEITKEFLSTELELYEDSQPAKSNQNVLLLKEEKAKQPREINEQLTEKNLQDVETSPKSTRGGLFGIFKKPKTEKSDFQKRESKEIQESQIASDHLQEIKNSQEFLSTEINLYEDSKPTILKVNLDQLKDEEKADKGKSKEIKEDIIEQTAQDVETLPKSTRGGLFGLFKKSKIEESEVLQKQVSKDIQESKIEDDLQKEITNSQKFLCTEVKLYEDSTRMASKQVTCQLKDEGKAEKRKSKEVKEEIIKHVTQDVESSPKTTRSGLFGLINKPKIKENEVFQKQNSKDIEQSAVTKLQTEAKYSEEFLSTKDKLLEDSKQNIPKKDVCQLQDDVKADKRKSKEDKGEIIEPIVLDVESSPKTSRGGLFGIFKKPKIGGSEVLQKQNSKEIQQSKIESDLQKEIPNSHEFLSTEIKLYEDSKPIITPDNLCDIQDEEKAEKRKSSEIKEEILEKTAQDVEASPKSSRGLFEIFKKSKKEEKELEHQTFTKPKDEQNELLNQINDSQQFLTTELKLYEDSKPVKSKEELSHSKELKRKSKEIKEEIVKSETQELGESPKTKRGGVFNIFKKSKTSVEEQEGEDLKKCKTDTQAFLSTEVEHYEDAKEIPTFVDTQNLTKSVESFPENDICTKPIGDQKQKAQDELNEGSEKTKNDIVNVKQFVTTEVEKYKDSEKFQREEIKPEIVKAVSTAPPEDHGGLFTTIFKKSKKDVESQNSQQENDEIAKDVKITCKEVKNASEVEGSPKTARGSIFNLFQKKPKKSEEHDDNEKAIKESQQAAIDTRDFLIKEKENYNDGDYKKEVKQADLEIVSQNIPVESSPRTSRVGVFNIFKKSRKSEERDELVSSDKTVLNEKDKPIDDIIISRQILFGVFKRSKKSEDKPTDFPTGSSRDSEEYILPEEVKKLIHLTDDFISVEIENYESGKHSFQQACSNENIKSDTARFLLDEVTNYYDSFGFKPEISEDIVEDNKFDNKCLVEEPPKVGFLAKFKKTKKKPSLEDTQIDNPILEPDIEKHEIEEEIKKEKPSKDKKSFFNIFGKKAKSQDSTESRGRTDEVETSPKKQKIRKSSSPFKFFEKSRKSEEETPKEMLEASETVIKEFESNVETQDRSSMSLTEELLENLEQKMKELKKDLSPETEKRISDCRDFLFIEKDNYEDSEPVVTDIDDEDVLKQVDSIIETAARAVEVKQGLLLETQTDNEDSISASQSAGGVNLVSKLGQLGDQVQTQKEAAATKLNLLQKESTSDGTKKLKIVEFAKDGISAEKVALDTDKTQVLQCLRGNIEELDAKTAKVKDSTQTVLEAHFKALHQNKDELSKAMQEESEKIDKTLKKMHETSEHTVERTAKASEDIFKEAKNVQTEVTVKGSELRQTSKDKINLQRDQSSTDFVQNAVTINLDDIQKTLSKETDGAKQKIQEEIKNVDDLSKDVITKVRDVRAGVKENWQDFQKDTKTKLETEKETVKDDTTKLLQLAESEFGHLASTTGDIKDVVEKKATAGFESFCKTLSNQEDQLKETVVELSDNIGKKNRTLEAHLNEEQDKLQDAFQKTENVLKTEVQSKTDGLGETIEALQSEVRKKADNVQETFKLQKNKTIEVLQCAKKDLEDIKSFTKQTVTTDLDNLQKKLSKETTKQVFTKEMVTTDLDNLQKELSKETTKQTRIEVDDLQAQFKKELEEIEQIIKQQKADASATSQYEHEVVADQSKSVSDKFESNGIFQTDKTIKSLTEEKETILKDVDTNKEKLTKNLTHVKENPSQYLRKIGELPKSVTANITQNVDNFQQTISAEYNKSYVTSPTMARRAVSQRLSQEDRPVVREVRYIEPDEENIETMYSVTEPEEHDATKKKPLFHLESEEDDSFETSRLKDRRESTNSNILETLSENKIDNLLSTLELQLVKDLEESASVVKITGSDTILEEETRKLETLKKESETDVEQIEQKLRDLDKALDSLEKESDPKLEKKLHRVERKFERMASEVLETDPVEVSPSEFQKLVSQLSTEEVSDFQKEYSHLWDETTFSKSDEWDSKTPDSQVDVQELPQGEEVLFAASGSGAQDTSKKAESDESGGQLQGRPISDQHQLSEEMKQLLQELERESKQ